MDLPDQYFRAGAGAVILNSANKILILHRSDIQDAWQLPQGGLKRGEDPFRAIIREIGEETGISENNLELIERYPEPLVYELPDEFRNKKTGRGQVQHWFLFRFTGQDEEIMLNGSNEFRAWRWIEPDDILRTTVFFKKRVYEKLMKYLKNIY